MNVDPWMGFASMLFCELKELAIAGFHKENVLSAEFQNQCSRPASQRERKRGPETLSSDISLPDLGRVDPMWSPRDQAPFRPFSLMDPEQHFPPDPFYPPSQAMHGESVVGV